MRRTIWGAASAALVVLAGAASAQEAGPRSGAGRYGGGLIEYLMTGRDPSLVARPLRPAPVAADGTILPRAAGFAAAYAEPPGAGSAAPPLPAPAPASPPCRRIRAARPVPSRRRGSAASSTRATADRSCPIRAPTGPGPS
ncbi:hypothetical protein QA634_18515 [Methylobacterium sp. CB376]|uniref:hypothetical protein n=1 Tax=Methylobacterium sp. CB376 TaxID=3138063 RepID=UPI0024B12A30|nr:hypothetical protein [Methylobacterium nodulans]WFT77332.1 hypothetical protein QA634_18515 [Methylobacterium nodulans]